MQAGLKLPLRSEIQMDIAALRREPMRQGLPALTPVLTLPKFAPTRRS